MRQSNFPKFQAFYLSLFNCKNDSSVNKQTSYLINVLFFLLMLMPFVVSSQNLLTSPTSLYNYQADNSANKGVNVSISEDGNVIVKGSPYANAGIGAATLYFRGNDGVWSPSLLSNGNDIVGNANFGSSVAISADATTIVVGANNDNNGVGAIWVYKRLGITNNYVQFGTKILPKDYNGKPGIGTSVGVSADGSTIIVGGPKDGLDVSVFESNPKQLTIFGVTISLPVPDPNQCPIYPVSYAFKKMKEKLDLLPFPANLGNSIIKDELDNVRNDLGVQENDIYRYNVGAAWVFKFNAATNSYYQDGDKMQNKGLDGLFPASIRDRVMNFGPSATLVPGLANNVVDSITQVIKQAEQKANDILNALRPIENVYSWLIGGILPSKVNGYVFTRNCYNIQPELNPLSPNFSVEMINLFNSTNSRLYENAYQGSSVAISSDGKTVMMGAPGLLNGKGITYVYRLDSNANGKVWIGEDVLTGDSSNGIYTKSFGNNLVMSPDGLNAIIGSPNSLKGTDTTGTAQIFVKNTSTKRWSKSGNNIMPSDVVIGSNKKLGLGTSFTISSDNDDIILGAPYDNNGKGAIWLYKPVSGTWTKQQKLTPSLSNGNFGNSVTIGEYGLTAVVGTPNTSSGGNAYVYNSCEPPKARLSQYADTICSGYQFNKYYQFNKRLNSSTGWVWRVGSENGSVFSPGAGESASNDSLIKKTLSGTTTYFVRGEGGCVNGKSVSITTVVKPTPSITSVTPTYICSPGGQVTLRASANSGTIKWIGSTWDGLRYGFHDFYESNPYYTAPYNYYKRDADPKQIAYGSGSIDASGNTYKPTISSSRNYYVSSLLNGCWSDTASVNARIERIVTKTGSDQEKLVCDDGFTLPLNAYIAAPDIATVRLQQVNSIVDQQIPTQLPITYKFYDNTNNSNTQIQSGSSNQLTYDLGRVGPNNLKRNLSYTLSNACGTSTPVSVLVRINAKGGILASQIKADSAYICPNTQAVFNLENLLIPVRDGYNEADFSFRIYDSATGGNFIDTVLMKYNFGTNLREKSIFRSSNALLSSRNYYVGIRNSCGESNRIILPVTVDNLAPPKVYNIKTTDVCGSGSVLLSAEASDGDVRWYNSPNAAVGPLANNTLYAGQYQTPSLTTTTNYWVSSTGAKCYNSQRILVQALVWEQPTLTVTTTAYNTCLAGDEAVLTASTDWGVINWYTTATGGTPFWTGSSVRVYPTTTTTYYAEADHYCKSARIAITVTVNDNLQITQTIPGSRANSGTVVLGATANIGTPVWTATDGSILGYGNSFTTNSINTTTTYYVAATANGCTSTTRIPVLATVNYIPIVNTTMNASRCGAGTVTLSASAEVGTIRWFDASYNQVGTGNTFTTPSLNATTTYYAQSWYLNASSNYDVSAFVPVKAYIYVINNPTITYGSGCAGQQPRVNISLPQMSVKYSLRNGTTVLDSKFANGINNNFDLYAPAISSATTYNVYAEKYDSSTALNFDGNNDYVEVLNHAGFNPFSNVMLAAWVNRNDIQKNNYIISKGSFSGNNGYSLSILNDYKLTLDIGSQRFQTTATIPANTWTHVAANYDGNTVKLYINGTLSASFTSVGSININQGNLIIGSSQDYKGDPNDGFSGKIDEVAVFCGVNFNTPIADIMNGKLVGNEYGLIAYYNFEHGANIINLVDICSNAGANNGKLNNIDSVNAWVSGAPINYCSAQISSSTLNPIAIPSIVNTIAPSRIGPGPVTLSAFSSTGATTQWYADSALTNNIATGNTYPIALLPYTTKFYAVASNGCLSPKVAVSATINDYPEEQQINCINSNTDIALFDNINLNASVDAIVRVGQYLFVGNGNAIINVYSAGSGSLTYVSSLNLMGGTIYHLEAANGLLYASDKSRNLLHIIDYSDITNLKLLGVSNFNLNQGTSFAVDGVYAYISSRDDQKLYTVDVSNPKANIRVLGTVNLGEAAYCVQKKDNIVYVGVNNVGIRLVDVSNIQSPYISRTLTFTGGSYNNFYVKGNYLYVSPAMVSATPYNTILKVYDISNASNPVFIRDVNLPDGYAINYIADSKYLYLTTYSQATGIKKMHILDISTPSNPVINVSTVISNNDGIAVRLGHIYTIGSSINDYAVTTAPSITSTKPAFRYGTGTVALSAVATGGTINWYAAATGGSSLGTGINFTTPSISATTTYYVGVSDGSCASARTPVVASVVDIPPCIASSSDIGTASLTGTLDVKNMYRSGNYLFITGESWIYAYNISSGSPVLIGTLDVSSGSMISDIKVVNNYLYAVARTSEKLFIVDISNPSSMQTVGSTSSIFNIPNGIWVEGNFAYVNNGDNHSLDVINIANPNSPSRVGQLTSLGDPAKGIQKKGNYVYLANWTYGFSVVDVSNPTSPSLVQHINSKESGDPTGAYNLYIIGNYLYVASDQGSSNPRIKIYDITNPSSPSLVNSVTPPFNVLSFDYDGIYLYCGMRKFSSSGNNVAIYRMTNLASPTLVATAKTTNNSTSVVGIAATSISNNGKVFAATTSFGGDNYIASFPVNNSATITSVTANSRCGAGSVSLQATASAGTITWYSDSAATNALGTGSNFNTPSILAPTTYYVNSISNGCSLPTIPVLATVNPVPTITNTVGATRRDTGTVDLQATTNTGLLKWYSAASGGSPVDYGSLFTTPIINNSTTFYVESQGELCTSTRVPVVATVITTPVIRSVTDGSRCLAGTVTLNATASIGTINWYDDNSSTTILATGNNFTTPTLSASRAYYVSTTNNGETSGRVAVFANIGSVPANANAGADINNFCGTSVNLTADSINGSSGQWSILSGVGSFSKIYGISTTLSNISSSVKVLWTVRKQFCPDKVDTVNINLAKPKPIFYTRSSLGSNYNNPTTLARYDRNTDSLTTIHAFYGSPDGKTFNSGLLLASNKKMYGTTEGGGTNGYGTIFEFDPKTNQYKVIYDGFNTGSVGRSPGTLIEGSPGVLYGCAGGGDNNNGVIFKFNYNTKQYTVIQQASTSVGADYPSKLTLVGNKIYGISRNGFTNNAGSIFSIDTATNAYTNLLAISSTYYGHGIGSTLSLGPDGNLYVTGNNSSLGTYSIYKYSISGNTFAPVYNFPTNGSMGNQPYYQTLFLALNNKFYFTTPSNGANGNGTLLEFDPIANTVTKKMDFASATTTVGGGSFMQASDGYLYSISTSGGTYGNGAFYRYNYTANTFEILKQLNCNIACNYTTPTEFPISDADAGSDQNICGRTTNLAAVSPVYGNGTWTVIKGAATIANPNSATSSITATTDTTILRWTVTDGLCYTSLDDVQIISKAAPVISSTSVNCNGGNGTYILNAVAAGATLNWYADNTSTTVLGTGNNFSVTPGSAVGYMYVDATINGCTSARQSVSFFAPLITSTRAGSRCNQGTVTLQATANTSLINWYPTATGGSAIGTGTNFTTPSISGTTVYYAEASNLGCSSARVAVTANIGNNNNNAIYPITYSASSIFNTQQSDENSCPNNAYKLFTTALSDSDLTTGIGTVNYTGESWIQAKFAIATTVTKVKLAGGTLCAFNVLNGNATAGVLNGSSLQYSNDGANWTTVTTISGVTDNAITTINVGSITAQYWRLYKSGNNYVAANEFSFDPMPTAISPLMADAGPDQTNCSNVFTVSGNTPTSGAGVWSVAFGTATIANPNSATTTVTTSSKNVILRWSFNSTSCGITADEVVLTNTSKSPLLWGSMGDRKIFSYNTISNTLKTQYTAGGGKDFSALKTIIKTSTNRIFGLSATGGANNTGLLFEYLPGTATVIPVHSFQNSSVGGLTEYNGSIFGYMPGALFAYNFNTNTYQEYGIPSNAIGASQAPYSKLTVAGNLLYGLTVNSIYSLDPATGTITHKYVIPGGNSYASAFVLASNGKLYATASSGGTSNQGSIFEYDYINNVFTVKYNFSGSDGSNAGATMCLANNNKLYGTCGNGGPNSGGTLFEYDYVNNSFTRKYSFVNGTGTDGSFPSSNGLLQASDGNLYGLTANGGTSGNGVMFKFNITSNSYTPMSLLSEQPTGGSTLIDYSVLTANAGPDQTVCTTTATMAANTPFEGSGSWSVVSGTATITSINSPTTTVTGIKGTAVLRWTVSYGSSCASTAYDDVVITLPQNNISTIYGTACGQTVSTTTASTAVPFDSTSSSLKLWIDATKFSTTNGGSLSGIIRDASSSSRALTTNATYETNTFNGRPAVRYNNNQTSTSASFNTSQNTYVFTTIQLVAAASTWGSVFYHWDRDNGLTIEQNGVTSSNVFHWQTANDNANCNQTISFGTNYIMAAKITGGNVRSFTLYTDSSGYLKNLGTVSNSSSTVSIQLGNLFLGKSDAGEYTNMRMGEFLYFQDNLPATEAAIVNYLYGKWFNAASVAAATVTLGATAQQGTLNWYSAATGGSSLGTGNTFTTPAISSNTTYYVDATANGCTTPRTPVVAYVSPMPVSQAITAVTNGTRCGAGTVTLGATAPQGTINWYAAATGGTSLGTGSSFTTASISTTTTYYVDVTYNGCTTPTRTAVVANIAAALAAPTITASGSTTICNGSSVSLNSSQNLGGTFSSQTQFVSTVIAFSSQYSGAPNWGAVQLLGAPNVYPSYGDIQQAWSPVAQTGGREYLELGFTTAVYANNVSIYETFNPGAVDTVYVKNSNTGNWVVVYSGTAAAAPATARINSINFAQTTFLVSQVRIALNNNAFTAWKEIDAVSISGTSQLPTFKPYLWSPSGETTSSIVVSTPGNYYVTIVDTNGCSATSAVTTVTLNGTGVIANAGPDQVNCSGSFTMAANSTGTWTVVSGAATITNTTSPTTTVTVTTSPAVLRWTITNAGCGTTTDDVLLTKTSSAPILLYPTTNEPNCTYCDVGAINLFDGNRNEVMSKKLLNVNTTTGVTPSGVTHLYRASDGVLYGIANSNLYNNNTQTDYTSNVFYYDPITNKPIVITGLTTSNYLRNITEYNGQLYIVMARANTISRIYIVNMSSKQATSLSFPGNVSSGHAPSGGLTVVGNKMYGTTNDGIYEFNPANNTFTWKYYYSSASLGGNNSDNAGELVLAANGKLYGKTLGGGANGYGTLYEYDVVNNTATARVNFATSSTGSRSIRSAVLVSNNLIYGTCHEGGTNNTGTLWEYNTSTNTFTVKYHFTLVNGTSNQLMQASNGKIYGVSSGPAGSGQIYSFDISTNSYNILKTYYNSNNGGTGVAGPLVEEKFVANAGADIITCSSSATMAAIPNLASTGAGKWTVVSGVATIANADSANTIITNLAGATTLRYTTNYGACSSSFDDITILSKPAVPTVTNGSRCGTGAGTVTLGATSTSPTGVVNWYADSTGGTSLGTGNSFTTPSISSTKTYYAEVTDKYNTKNVNYTYSNLYEACNFSNTALNDNNFTTGIVANRTNNSVPSWIQASFDSANTISYVYVACGILCNGRATAGYNTNTAIYYSNDNINWTYVTAMGGVSDANGKIPFSVGNISARYWRLQGDIVAVTEFSFGFTTNFSCTSNRVPVTAYIGTAPTITSTTAGSGCSTATLQATASAGTVKWYAAATGADTALATGNSFTTPSLTNNTTYYAAAINGGCESSRTAVTATINVPSITCAANMVVSNTNNQCGATVTVTAPTVSNTCGGAAPTLTNNFNNTANASGNYPIGTTTVVWTATNANGNTATCTQTITVNDNQSPNTVCRNKTIYLNASGVVNITAADINNGSTDNCSIASYEASKTSFDCSNVGANQVLLTVTDVNGNAASCASIVTVLDTIKPVITAPANISVNSTTGVCGATVSFSANATDNCSIASITYSPASGSLFSIGTTSVTATATDAAGNSKSATFTVTVVDNQNPTITCPANLTLSCTASTDTSNTGKATATDNCGIQSITYSDVSTKSNNAALCTFYSYTITRTWTATDINSRTSNCVQTITVVDNVKPVITSSGSSLSLGCNPTNAAIEAALGSATATDNCSTMGTPTATDGAVIVGGNLRSQTRSFNISDICGNAAITVIRTATWTVLSPASVSIAASANNVCAGSSVTFTATPTNGGTSPAYQWSKNGVAISGATAATYTYVPANGDTIRCVMTATNACETNVVVNSNDVRMIVNANTSSTTNLSICASAFPYTWNGLTFTTAGSQTAHLTNAAGCDSAATLNLVNSGTSTTDISICPSELPYTWNGLTFNAAGSQTKTGLTNSQGCDSSATLNLIVKTATSSTQSIAICPSQVPYTWNGLTFSTTGSQTAHLINAAGCDSAATLTVTVKSISTSQTNINICVSSLPYSWNGLTFNAAGSQTAHLMNAVGCDSAATLNLTVISANTWTGAANSTSWSDAGNWCGGVPANGSDVIIAASAFTPVLPSDKIVGALTLNDTIALGGYKLTINGAVTGNNKVITGSNTSSIEYTATAASTVYFDQTISADVFTTNGSNALMNISKTGSGTLTLGNKVNLFNVLSVTGGTLDMGGNLVLRSTALNTARVGVVSGTIAGQAIVERYMHHQQRGWRAITAPITYNGLTINDSSNTIKRNWQSDWGYASGYGTRVTGPSPWNPPINLTNAYSKGFDDSTTNHSLQTYNSTTGKWSPVTNTFIELQSGNAATAANKAFYIFVRGDKTVTPTTSSPNTFNPTTLAAKGLLQTGTQVFNFTGTVNKSWLVGNPYACPVDMSKVDLSNAIYDYIYIWDPNITGFSQNTSGNYVTFDRTAWAAGASAGTNNKYFQSGQAFFVKATSSSSSITFHESDKVDSNNMQHTGTMNGLADIFNIKLMSIKGDGSKTEVDGVRAKFGAAYSAAVDGDDADKWVTTGIENMSLLRNTKSLVIEARPYILTTDSLFLNMASLNVANYEFKVNPINFDASVSSCKLVDRFLNTETPISLTSVTTIGFNVTSVAGSSAANRFYVVFNGAGSLPTNGLTVKAYKKNKTVVIDWEAIAENNVKVYNVEKSIDGTNFSKLGEAAAKNANATSEYSLVDNNPVVGVNYYRIKTIQNNSNTVYSRIVRVEMTDKGVKSITVYPNPVKGSTIGVQMSNLEAGVYTARLFNSIGQQIWTNSITHNGNNGSISLDLGKVLAAGSYQISFTDTKGNSYNQSVIAVE